MKAKLRRGVLAVLAACPPVFAEQAVQKGERIEVTGSRLASSDAESASPVAVIRAEDIRMEGFQSLELVLNNFPQFFGDQGNRISNGATGTATANLRALGAQRTLVLVNGRRLPAGSPFNLAADLNQIPPALIQRVEVLTGGASAVYGSDAMAGVVNFILNDRFEGVQGDIGYEFYNHQQKNGFVTELLRARDFAVPGDKSMDGESTNASLVVGGNFAGGKGNAVVAFRYLKSKALLQSERDYSACTITPNDDASAVICGGTGVGNPGIFVDLGSFVGDPEFDPRPGRALTIDRPTGGIRSFRATDLYNFAPLNFYQRPQERYGFNALVNYDFSADTRLYSEFGYHDDSSLAQIAPSGIFRIPALIRWENPLLSESWRAALTFRDENGNVATGPGTVANMQIGRRNTEGGGRQDDRRHTSFREVLGLKGRASQWDYDIFFQTSRVNYQERYSNDFSLSRSLRALDVVSNPSTGAPVCASVLNGTDPACVPYNVWSLDAITPAALAYLQVPAFQRAVTSQQVYGGTVSANLGDFGIRMPRTRTAIEVALGVERRTEKLDFEADQQFTELAGQGQPIRSVKGGFAVNELFGELRVPVFDVVNLNGSYRLSKFDTGVSTNTFGLGFNAAPSKYLRLRGSYQKAVRAPNVTELYEPQFPSLYDLADPCAGAAPSRSLADCQRTGVTADRYGRILPAPFDENPSTQGGNPQLTPETANTYTLGFVLTPFRDFSATVDYFDIRIADTIYAVGGDVVFTQCINSGDPYFCNSVRRDPVSQSLWLGAANVTAINRNIGKTRVSGADVALNYRLRFPQAHSVGFDMLGTYLRSQSIVLLPGATPVDCEGQYNTDCTIVPLPKWRHRLRVTWQPPWNFDLAATWRYIGSTRPAEGVAAIVPGAIYTLPAVSYLDLAAAWNITKRITLRGGVSNVADRDPPLTFGWDFQVNGNAYAHIYDVLGRHVFVSASLKF